ncbi:MAG TPA: response regulator [Burkholderiales bacterium]|nr:response regulator [Burkholderiales bacterium]
MNTEVKAAPEVLVIDDDAIMRDLVADWLEAAGYRVRKATSCRAWVEQFFGVKSPSLIVTDMFMPGPCGVDAIGDLKKKHPRAGLIAVSGHFNSGEGLSAQEALAAGADRALGKPIRRAELLQAVAELLGAP